MHALVDGLAKAWREEPILMRATPVLTAIAAYLIRKYVADAELSDLLLGLVLIVGGGGGALWARSVVTPLAKLPPAPPRGLP